MTNNRLANLPLTQSAFKAAMFKLSLLGQVEADFDFDASSAYHSRLSDFVDCSDVIPESKVIQSVNKRSTKSRTRARGRWSKRSDDDSDDGDEFQDYPELPAGKSMKDIEQAVSFSELIE